MLKFNNILITGGAGFLGSNLAVYLSEKYASSCKIYVYDNLSYSANLKNLDDVASESNFTFIHGDVGDFDKLLETIKSNHIDCVVHFAAVVNADLNPINLLKLTETNVLGSHVVLESARQAGVARFIHISTDEVYGDTGDNTADESYPTNPTNPYACSKLAAECMLNSYVKFFNMNIVVCRCNNAYGPRQFLEKLIPKFVARLAKGQKCCIHDDGASYRDFLYVTDVAAALETLINNAPLTGYHVYNIGARESYSVIQVAKQIVDVMQKKVLIDKEKHFEELVEYVPGRIVDDRHYRVNCDSIKSLGWKQTIEFEQGLEKTVEWYCTHLDHWSNSDYALAPHPSAIHSK